ncbi:hypothetical protein [Erwinia sp.]|uniref:hypothetical protein n=1 Tax=Erwinia citreus TaxID=558 RepID=UPI003C745720
MGMLIEYFMKEYGFSMNAAKYYYLIMAENGVWILHLRGCDKLSGSKEKIFLGTLYTSRQAIGVAKKRVEEFRLCYVCFRDEIKIQS